MLEKTKKFYEKLGATLKTNNLRQLTFEVDEEAFKNFLLHAAPTAPPSGKPIIDTAVENAAFFVQPFSDAKKLFFHFVADCLYKCEHYSPLVFLSDEDEIILYFINDEITIPKVLQGLQKYFEPYFPLSFSMVPAPSRKFLAMIEKRSKVFHDKYSPNTNEILKKVWDRLGDDISRISLSAYLNQRYTAYVHARYETIYPGKAPAQTRAWREERETLGIPAPKLAGVSPFLLKLFHYHTFVMEQYATPGCMVEEGDVVIDGGAFVGDTTIYFSEKVGRTGTVYAFEPVPENVENLRKTLSINHAEYNTKIVPRALSDKKQTLHFLSNQSASIAIDEEGVEKIGDAKELLSLEAIDLDSFIKENAIKKVDYLKADLEGADIDFLNGARETIKTFSPKCGLVVYHKPDDVIDIPRILLECQPGYRFYFRMEAEPILFATL